MSPFLGLKRALVLKGRCVAGCEFRGRSCLEFEAFVQLGFGSSGQCWVRGPVYFEG